MYQEEIEEMFPELVEAIFVNDLDRLLKFYAKHDLGTDIVDEHGMTPLQHAAYKGNEQIVRWLLDRVSGGARHCFTSFVPLTGGRFVSHREQTSIQANTSISTPRCISPP